jgi:hypothetical protein
MVGVVRTGLKLRSSVVVGGVFLFSRSNSSLISLDSLLAVIFALMTPMIFSFWFTKDSFLSFFYPLSSSFLLLLTTPRNRCVE